MPLQPGTSLGPYQILAPLGAGGMGEVYRAKDTRLDREVAVKVLPQHLSDNAELKQRFEREARTASSLNHPNICTVFDVGSQDGTDFLVMELMDGESLAQRLEKGPLATEEALRFGMQVADALDKSHRRGLIHRDLKPGNIMITKDGAKLMDFGLAKAMGGAGADSPMTAAATMSSPLTAEGTIVGTFQYMAPEQLEGSEATSRSDIYSFGTVLYEMLSGRRPFQGKTQAALAASILKETPRSLAALQPMTPPALERLVATCMEKDPDERRQTMHDVLLELRWINEGGSQAGVPVPTAAKRRSRETTAWGAAALMAVIAAAAIGMLALRTGAGSPGPLDGAIHLSVSPPEEHPFDLRRGPMALSPDGSRIVFVARSPEGDRHLWIRHLDRPTPRRLDGTEGAQYPFWSPDGRSIAFFATDRLKRIAADGGPPDTICDATGFGAGGSWGPDDSILFSEGWSSTIKKVAATGGSPEDVTGIHFKEGDFAHRFPVHLPGGRRFLFNIRSGRLEANTVVAASLDDDSLREILTIDSNVAYSPTGHLLFWREGALRAQRFDPDTLELSGAPVPVAPESRFDPGRGYADYSISSSGILAYRRGAEASTLTRLTLFDREGTEKGFVGPPGNFYAPRFSNDGRRVAVDNSGLENNGDIWIYEVDRPGAQRVTFDSADQSMPAWSPDDGELAFFSTADGSEDVYLADLSRESEPVLLADSPRSIIPLDWSPDGETLLASKASSGGAAYGEGKLVFVNVRDGTVEDWETPESSDPLGVFSPDGRWIAYTSDGSGRKEIYVKPFPGPGPRRQISLEGGTAARWRADGGEIFYIAPTEEIMAVAVEPGDEFDAGPPVPLFRMDIRDTSWAHYDVTANGQTFVVNILSESKSAEPMSLVLNWTALLEQD